MRAVAFFSTLLLAISLTAQAEAEDIWSDAKAARAVWSDCMTAEARMGVRSAAPAEDVADAALLKCGPRSDALLNTLMAPPAKMSTEDAVELVKQTKAQGRAEIIAFIKKSRGD